MMNDSISDFLIRIKNGYLARHEEVSVPYSKIIANLAKILVVEKYLEKCQTKESKLPNIKELVLTLKYDGKKPVLTDIQRISKPSLRIYLKNKNIPKVLGGLGIIIISTPKGLMTGYEAKKQGLGGEAICKIW